MNTLAIETSCDETAAAVLDGEGKVLASEIATQIDLHRAYGGVVPEVASRNHLIKMRPVLLKALEVAGLKLTDIDVFGATAGPGLAGALLTGNTHGQGPRIGPRETFRLRQSLGRPSPLALHGSGGWHPTLCRPGRQWRPHHAHPSPRLWRLQTLRQDTR